MTPALVLLGVPLCGALLLLLPRARALAVEILLGVAVVCVVTAGVQAVKPEEGAVFFSFFRLTPLLDLFLLVVDPVLLGVSAYVWSRTTATPALRAGMPRFVALVLVFMAAAHAVLLAHDLLVQWLALEATTLAAAPLIVRKGVAGARQAAFRYLLFSSVGLGVTLLGFLCFERDAAHLDGSWTALGLGLAVLGIGTKLGLAPLYTWLPEAYEEAPAPVTALLGAVQFNCALAVLFRLVELYRHEHGVLLRNELLTMGILSMVVSTVSIIATTNIKRLIAYASINHAGVIAIGLGVGKGGAYGLLLYVISNAFIKAVLFLTAGKIEAHYKTRETKKISGLLVDLPYSGVFLMIGTFALLGLPPFSSFFGELLILSALVQSNQMLVFSAFCCLITMTFVATGRTIFPMIWGAPKEKHDWPRQTFVSVAPKMFLLLALVALGLYVPPFVDDLIVSVAQMLEGA